MIEKRIREAIRDVHDFPSKGIVFKDITPIFQDPVLCDGIIDHMYNLYKDDKPDVIAGIESRGFFFGLPLAIKLGIPFVPIRKQGKLPYETVSYSYDLEYGSATIEMHTDAIQAGQKVMVHDDLLATGGTAGAAAELIHTQGATLHSYSFLVELEFLGGVKKIRDFTDNISILARY